MYILYLMRDYSMGLQDLCDCEPQNLLHFFEWVGVSNVQSMVATFFFYSYPKLQEPHINIPLKMLEVWSFNWQRNNCQKYSTPFRPHLLVTIYVRNGLLLCHFNLAIIHEVSLLGYSVSKLSTNLHPWVSHIIPLAFLILLPVHHLWHSPVPPISPSSPVWWSLKLVVCWQWD